MRLLSHCLDLHAVPGGAQRKAGNGLPPARLRKLLPAEFAAHCSGACVCAERLVIFVDSGTWATALWYRKNGLLHALRGEFPALESLHLRVIPPHHAPHHRPQRPSPAQQAGLLSVAAGVRVPELRRALRALAGAPPEQQAGGCSSYPEESQAPSARDPAYKANAGSRKRTGTPASSS